MYYTKKSSCFNHFSIYFLVLARYVPSKFSTLMILISKKNTQEALLVFLIDKDHHHCPFIKKLKVDSLILNLFVRIVHSKFIELKTEIQKINVYAKNRL